MRLRQLVEQYSSKLFSTKFREQTSFQVDSYELKLCLIFLHNLFLTTYPASISGINSHSLAGKGI
jgi:hypothetical protein